ncbi:AmmeMemoRadiSam system radical SAM enzyme [candidate division WWE3 bacterium CG08_land_8_20_14_0_20_43_13]|uniref:AmmeMemoRadiSam system radical SAM enzyme n=1 Tax=candidate division WWE3 bacterium CG08_land_8_20_14_0_20_43_13 TaxID=1975087 RepID=A0A2H0X6K1_UNCKA|nr:MAG: AmmeMemoRadiSam system radical SAM enzyme [candidate division WWE3 bacterium CG08_land_8_20_14_0_20_43_13]
MREKLLFKKSSGNLIACCACCHKCSLSPGARGRCGVRLNRDGEGELSVYGYPTGLAVDPVEKKPLFHFLPGTKTLSLGTLGCNFSCSFCQNWTTSQAPKLSDVGEYFADDYISPAQIVAFAKERDLPSISYTYNEPTVFIEYAYDIGILAREKGLKNIWVSNGYFSNETLGMMGEFVDAANIDLKSFRQDFYRDYCGASLEPVLENIKSVFKKGIWLELTTLVIHGLNDSIRELTDIAEFIVSVSVDIPWHVSAFYPAYKMETLPPTPPAKIQETAEIGKKAGLKFVYPGNLRDGGLVSTSCSKCSKVLLSRSSFHLVQNSLASRGECRFCGAVLPGVWS